MIGGLFVTSSFKHTGFTNGRNGAMVPMSHASVLLLHGSSAATFAAATSAGFHGASAAALALRGNGFLEGQKLRGKP